MPDATPAVEPEAVHAWFGLSYANYLVVPRTLMQSMPDEWQHRMVACLEELHDAFAHVEQAACYDVIAGREVEAGYLSDRERNLASVDIDPESGQMWGPNGFELDEHARVFLPGGDPVPHYNRGRTHIPPRLPARDQSDMPEGA